MKRSILQRRSGLKRTGKLRRSRPLASSARLGTARQPTPVDPAAAAFKQAQNGSCWVCGSPGLVRRHHVIREQDCRREGWPLFDLRNAMWLGVEGLTCDCHEKHHNASRRIPADLIPDPALSFAITVMGMDRAALYFAQRYAPAREARA